MIHAWYAPWTEFAGIPFASMGTVFMIVLVVWSAVWKGLALWNAARDGSKPWFVVLFLLNTLGILEILYIYVFRDKKQPAHHHAHTASSEE
jgi:uncharacterized membrane protein YagU involved in acid resistance